MNVFGLENGDLLDRVEVARRSLNNLLTSYADEADVFTESVQNAVDAVVRAKQDGLYGLEEVPRITIVIGRPSDRHHYLFVADNGLGMSPEVARNITVPGFSYGKRRGESVGYKGVGASYFFAATNRAALRTVDMAGTLTEYTVYGSHNWIRNADERVPEVRPVFDVPPWISDSLLPRGRGTSVFFQFHEAMRPSSLSNTVIVGEGRDVELRSWVSFLCSKTPLGSVWDRSDSGIEVSVVLDAGDGAPLSRTWALGSFSLDERVAGYPFPHLVLRTAKDIEEIDRTEDARRYIHQSKYPAVYKTWSAQEVIEDTGALEEEERAKLLEHLDWVYTYFCYSTEVMKEVNRRLGGRTYLVKHGIRIASDGVAQGRNIDLSLTSSQGLDRQTHVVMSFKRLELDTGRKISADEVVASAIAKIGRRVVDVVKEYRWAMKKKDRPDVQSDLVSWRNDVDARARRAIVPLLFTAQDAPLLVDPSNEQEVIALFTALVARGHIKGLQVEALSGFERYDCLVDVLGEPDRIRDELDPLAVRSATMFPAAEKRVLEFKHSFSELLQDFNDRRKNPAEIDIVVCWFVPEMVISRGRLQPCYGEWRDHRALHSASYTWSDENETSSFPILALQNIVAELIAKRELDEGKEGQGRAELRRLQDSDRDGLV
jgi:hypothetical protein